MNHTKKALIGNILLFLMELAGFIVMLAIYGDVKLKYYTNWSNILGIIAATLFIINYFINEKNKTFNDVVKYVKLTSTICLTVTFFIVLCVFIPMDHFNFYKWAIRENFFSFHFFAPIIAFICFIFLEKYDFTYIKDTIIGMIFTILYSITISILILAKKVEPPYPFLDYYAHSVIVNIVNVSLVFIFSVFVTVFFIFIKKKTKESMLKYY